MKKDYTKETEKELSSLRNDMLLHFPEWLKFGGYAVRIFAYALLAIAQEIRIAAEPKIKRE